MLLTIDYAEYLERKAKSSLIPITRKKRGFT